MAVVFALNPFPFVVGKKIYYLSTAVDVIDLSPYISRWSYAKMLKLYNVLYESGELAKSLVRRTKSLAAFLPSLVLSSKFRCG